MGRIGGNHPCSCCGAKWSESGCVRGPTCSCLFNELCYRCHRCAEHCGCPGGRVTLDQRIAETPLRPRAKSRRR